MFRIIDSCRNDVVGPIVRLFDIIISSVLLTEIHACLTEITAFHVSYWIHTVGGAVAQRVRWT